MPEGEPIRPQTGPEVLSPLEQRLATLEETVASLNERLQALEATQAALLEELQGRNGATAEGVKALGGAALSADAEPTTQPTVRVRAQAPTATAVVSPRTPATPNKAPAKTEKSENWFKRNGKRILAIGAIGVAGFGTAVAIANEGNESAKAPTTSTETTATASTASTTETTPTTTTSASTTETTTNTSGGAEAGSTSLKKSKDGKIHLTAAQLAKYRNKDTGSDAQGLIGNFEINEHARSNFYREIRHNPETLAEMKAALDEKNPSYNSTVGDAEVLAKMNALKHKYEHMSAKEKKPIADAVIKKLQNMRYLGVTTHSGPYKTISVEGNKLVADTNSRVNDEWMSFRDGDGNVIHIRACAQLVEKMPPSPRTPRTPRTPVTPSGGPGGGTTPHNTTGGGNGGGHLPKHNITHTGDNGGGESKKEACLPGYVPFEDRCVHKPASGPPKDANQKPRPQPSTPGYTPGNAEKVDGTQHGDPTNLDPTPNGTEAPNGAPAGQSTQGQGGQPNPNYDPNTTTPGTSAGTSNPEQTEGSGQTSGAGSDPGGF